MKGFVEFMKHEAKIQEELLIKKKTSFKVCFSSNDPQLLFSLCVRMLILATILGTFFLCIQNISGCSGKSNKNKNKSQVSDCVCKSK